MLDMRCKRETRARIVPSDHQSCPEQQLEFILGHPVKRTIVDSQGEVILDVGDLISYEAVEKAKKSQVIDVLLTSVYRK